MKTLARGLLAAAAMTAAAPAMSADVISIEGNSGTYGNSNVQCAAGSAPCAFMSMFSFATPAGQKLVSASISSVRTGNNAATNIDFTSVTLNGVNFNVLSTGIQEFRNLLNQNIVSGGTNTILVNGTTGGDAAFSGNLSFAGAVPEPTTWAMLIIGFGAVGGSLRLRTARKTALAV